MFDISCSPQGVPFDSLLRSLGVESLQLVGKMLIRTVDERDDQTRQVVLSHRPRGLLSEWVYL